MADLGMTFAELRVVDGKNIIDHTDAEVDDVRSHVEARGMRVLSIASPVLKCALPDAPPIAPHIQQDMFSSAFGFDDQPRLATRAFEIAERSGAQVVRVFSYWRTVDPEPASIVSRRLCASLRSRPASAVRHRHRERARVQIATGAETARLLAAVSIAALAGHLGSGERACCGRDTVSRRLRSSFRYLASSMCTRRTAMCAIMCPYLARWAKWRSTGAGQIAALARDGYRRTISLETHWKGPNGDKFQGSIICGRNLQAMVRHAGI